MRDVTSSDVSAEIEHDEIAARLDTLLDELDPRSSDSISFLNRQFDLGLAWVHFPVGLGGLGLGRRHQSIVDERLREVGAPSAWRSNVIGHGMGAPTLLVHGSEKQKQRYLRPLFTGEEIWCQLFSEPGAGSDLAGLATRAVRDDSEWVVNGQKVWTSSAHRAHWGLLLARTDPGQPKHRGLSYFVIDMRAPGVDVRPLVQLTGEAEFNEVFLSDVRIPDSERLGAVGEGWRVALTTLMNERVAIGAQSQPRGGGLIADAVRVWGEKRYDDDALRDRLVALWIKAEALRLTNIRSQQTQLSGPPGPAGSIAKLVAAELNQEVSAFTLELLGAEGMLKPEGYELRRLEEDYPLQAPGTTWGSMQQTFLRTRANSIEGGTSEIMRNILAERVLGLPADARSDKDVPWNTVRRA